MDNGQRIACAIRNEIWLQGPLRRAIIFADIAQTPAGINMGASLYEPINVYKAVAPDIGIVDGPFEYLTVGGAKLPLPFTTRMTVVCLSNGDLFLHSPIKFDQRLANGLQGLG